MRPALTDWNHVVGISKPPSIRLVRRSVNRLRLEPACSKASQKTALKSMKTKIVAVGARSLGSRPATNRTAQPTASTASTNGGRVELAHHHREAGLEVSGADHDERKPEDENGHAGVRPCERSNPGRREDEVAERDQKATDDHRAVRPEQSIGDPSSDDREQIR